MVSGWTVSRKLTSFKINCAHHFLTSAIYLRQSILLSAYETAETRSLYNSSLRNVAGKIRTEKHWQPIAVPDGFDQVGLTICRQGELIPTSLSRILSTLIVLVLSTNLKNGSIISPLRYVRASLVTLLIF